MLIASATNRRWVCRLPRDDHFEGGVLVTDGWFANEPLVDGCEPGPNRPSLSGGCGHLFVHDVGYLAVRSFSTGSCESQVAFRPRHRFVA
jgi:hypothetical protein